MPTLPNDRSNIVFFDGVCSLCNGFVDFLMRHDHRRALRYGSLQGKTAAQYLPSGDISSLESIVFYDGTRTWKRSDAVLRIFARLGGPWAALSCLRIVPRFIRDAVYDLVAKYRYRVFGQRETCRIPTPEERSFFLD